MVQSGEPDRSTCIYYYGTEHLNVNLNMILKKEREKNRKVIFFFGSSLWERVMVLPTILSQSQIAFLSEINETTKSCLGRREEELLQSGSLINEAERTGYGGLTLLFDVKDLIQRKTKKGYLLWQSGLESIDTDFPYQNIFLYDAEDYLERQDFIDYEVISHSLKMNRYQT